MPLKAFTQYQQSGETLVSLIVYSCFVWVVCQCSQHYGQCHSHLCCTGLHEAGSHLVASDSWRLTVECVGGWWCLMSGVVCAGWRPASCTASPLPHHEVGAPGQEGGPGRGTGPQLPALTGKGPCSCCHWWEGGKGRLCEACMKTGCLLCWGGGWRTLNTGVTSACF